MTGYHSSSRMDGLQRRRGPWLHRVALRHVHLSAATWILLALAWLAAPVPIVMADPRLRITEHPQVWADALVRIETPARNRDSGQQSIEHCTGSLVDNNDATWVLTAWHCISEQRDLAHPPRVEISGHWHPARVIASGGSMDDDWAILQVTLSRSITYPNQRHLKVSTDALTRGDKITLAGFSRDEGLGSHGSVLTYHKDCEITATVTSGLETNCVAHRGASGGPVLTTDHNGDARLAGVLSAGDRHSRSIIVSASRFGQRLGH